MRVEELPIAEPCGLDFGKMTRAEANRRFCGACKKHVHDLTLLSEPEAKELLASPRTEGLCVRYAADANGKIVFLPEVPAARLITLTTKKRTALAAVAFAAAAATTGCASRMMGGPMSRPDPASAQLPHASYELVRAGTRISISQVPGVLRDMTVASDTPGCQRPNQYVDGMCSGDEAGCQEVRTTLDASASADDFIGRLQTAGFVVVQRRMSSTL